MRERGLKNTGSSGISTVLAGEDWADVQSTCVLRNASTSQRPGRDHGLVDFTGVPSTKTVLRPAAGSLQNRLHEFRSVGPLGASTQKALPVVELEAWTPIGRAQQGLYSTGQIDEHVAHEEEPGVEGPVRLLTTHNGTVLSFVY